MIWNSPNNPPKLKGVYHVVIVVGNMQVYYTAFYQPENNTWYKYDPFDLDYKPRESITENIIVWSKIESYGDFQPID